jgi:molybdopterin-guanine dinucleotide biosynthesis protein A
MTGRTTPLGVAGAIIAGGEARRMGGGLKYMLPLAGQPILDHVIERAAAQCAPLLFNGAAPPPGHDLPLVPDHWPGEGPLSGILSCLMHCQDRLPDVTHLLTMSADTPFFPADLAVHLQSAGADVPVSAESGGRRHGVFTLWPIGVTGALESLFKDGQRSVNRALDALGGQTVAFPASPTDPFFNINTPDDLAEAERLASNDR